MTTSLPPSAITGLLRRWSLGDREALSCALPLVYDELRAIARSYMSRERSGHTLGATGLVHEAFLRLSGQPPAIWQDRKHFYGIAARLMRQILVDYSRYHGARKRDGASAGADATPIATPPRQLDADYLALDECLSLLERTNQRRADIVELRFFGGLTIAEIAESKELSPSMVKKELAIAKVWLFERMQGRENGEPKQPGG